MLNLGVLLEKFDRCGGVDVDVGLEVGCRHSDQARELCALCLCFSVRYQVQALAVVQVRLAHVDQHEANRGLPPLQ